MPDHTVDPLDEIASRAVAQGDRFTPPPWSVEEMAPDCPELLRDMGLVMAGDEDVAYVSLCEDGEQRANASLIAAAPDLLAAAKLALETPGMIRGRDSLRAAVEKAESRSTNSDGGET